MRFFTWFLKSLYHQQTILASRLRPTIHVLGHVCFTILFALLPYCLVLSVTIWSGFTHIENGLSNTEVDFTIKNGELHTDVHSIPYTDEVDPTFALFIDPTNQLSAEEMRQNGLLLQGREAFLQTDHFEQSLPYTLLGNDIQTKTDILNQIVSIKSFLPILFIILSVIIVSVMIGSAFLATSMMALIASLFFRQYPNIQYIHLWKIAAHVMPLPVITYAWLVVWMNDLSILLLVFALIGLYMYLLTKLPRKKKSRKTS